MRLSGHWAGCGLADGWCAGPDEAGPHEAGPDGALTSGGDGDGGDCSVEAAGG